MQYDLHQEKYISRVLWQTDQALYSDIRINEYRGYHHIVASYNSNSYIVYIDCDWRPRIVKVEHDGTASEVLLDSADYHIRENDSHQFFAIGVDRDGYIHVFGDMHNFPRYNNDHLPARYQNARCMYWRSRMPEDINDFEWHGEEFGDCPFGTSFSYPQIFYDQNGGLYFSARVRSETALQYAAVNYNSYNTVTCQWELIGGTNEFNNQCLFYEDNGEGGGTYSKPCRSLHFDLRNTAHFVSSLYNSDRDKPFPESNAKYNTDLVYAASDDFGMTFRRSDGTSLYALPMRIDSPLQKPDLILSNTIIKATASEAVTDYKGNPYVVGEEYNEDGTEKHFCYSYDMNNRVWKDISDLRPSFKGYFVTDRAGVITFFASNTFAMYRFFEFGKDHVVSIPFYDVGIDRRHMLETGNIRGIPRRTSASQMFQLIEVEIERPVSYPAKESVLSFDAELMAINPEIGILYPEFLPERHRYTLYVPRSAEDVSIAAVPKHTKAVVTGDGKQNDIPKMAIINVVAEDNLTKLTYEINIVKTDMRTFYPDGDSYLRNGDYRTLNYNTDEIWIKTANHPNYQREGLMKFAIEKFRPEEINAVLLKLMVIEKKGWPLLQLFDSNTDWDENMITWEGAEKLITNNEPFAMSTILTGDDTAFIWINITEFVKEHLSHDTIFGFRLVSEIMEASCKIASKEYIDTLMIPEVRIIYGASLSDDALLQYLSPDVGIMEPDFDPMIFEYDLEVPSETCLIYFHALVNHPGAWIEGGVAFHATKGNANINVTAEDGVTVRNYRINIRGTNTSEYKPSHEDVYHIYPNPATNMVHIQLNENIDGIISLRNILGHKVLQKRITSEIETLNLASVPGGLYILTLEDGSNILLSMKIVIR